MEYGLIGEKLGHSFSKQVHEQLADYEYTLMPLAPDAFDAFMRARDFKAVNVTIPYKQRVIPYCDTLEPVAAEIGAVNTIVNRNGRLTGYNTDFAGMQWLLQSRGVELRDRVVLLLGSGGTSRTARAVARAQGAAQVLAASRSPGGDSLSYEQAAAREDVQVVINTSPVGMYPGNLAPPLVKPAGFPRLEAVVDAVYNPLKTLLLMQAEACGVAALNGLPMLVAQAKYACEYFLDAKLPESEISRITLSILRSRVNVSLVGMPGCGKTSLGRVLAKRLGRQFVDTDKWIVQQAGMSIPQIFERQGEAAFRDWESKAARQLGAQSGQVIATGGGIVKRAENIPALRQNGMVLFLDAPLDSLAVGSGRPLTKSREDLERLAGERMHLYRAAADAVVEYNADFSENVARLGHAFEAVVAGLVIPG